MQNTYRNDVNTAATIRKGYYAALLKAGKITASEIRAMQAWFANITAIEARIRANRNGGRFIVINGGKCCG